MHYSRVHGKKSIYFKKLSCEITAKIVAIVDFSIDGSYLRAIGKTVENKKERVVTLDKTIRLNRREREPKRSI